MSAGSSIGPADARGHLPGARRGSGRRGAGARARLAPTRRSSGSRRAASAAPTSTSTTGGSRSSRASCIGHEYVGTVIAVGDEVDAVAVGDRVLGTYCTACGECFFCKRGDFHKCDDGRVFGHGKTLGSLQGAQAELALGPERRPHPAQGARGDVRRRRPVRRRRDGHRLPRGGRVRASSRARSVAVLGLGPGRPLRGPGRARRGRRRGRRGRHGSPSGSSSPARSAPSPST